MLKDTELAYRDGREAARNYVISVSRTPIEAPRYDMFHSKRLTETLTKAFWQGVSDWRKGE